MSTLNRQTRRLGVREVQKAGDWLNVCRQIAGERRAGNGKRQRISL